MQAGFKFGSLRSIFGFFTLLSAAAAPAPAHANGLQVELELVLAVDASASISKSDYQLQIKGLADAFRHQDVISAIEAHGQVGIAVTLVQWSSGHQQLQGVPWRHLTGEASSLAFARAIEGLSRPVGVNTTAIGSAIRFSVRLIEHNAYSGLRHSIDISGDGSNNDGDPIWVEKNQAIAKGITINGLAILNGNLGLEDYYRNHVIGGPGAFLIVANDFFDFTRAMRQKLIREINPAVAFHPPEELTQTAEND